MAVAVMAVGARGDVINVPADQPTIQAGIGTAVNGDEVVVAPGAYAEIIDLTGKAITVRSSGGAAVTTIDATTVTALPDGKPVVRCDTGEGPDTVIEGFTITGGTGDTALFGADGFGGGIWMNGTTPTIRACVIEFNAAYFGGGVFVNQGSPTFDGCTIRDNNTTTDGSGGGLYLFDNSGVTMTGCTVSENNSEGPAGGMRVDGGTGTVVITDSVFENNTATAESGAIDAPFFGSLTVERCEFRGNTAGNTSGGAMSLSGDPAVRIANSTFISNIVLDGGSGGAIDAPNEEGTTIVNCAFSGNSASAGGGALDISNGNSVVNCSFANNSAPNGSAIRAVLGGTYSAEIVNCAMWGNTGSAPITSFGSGTLTVDYSIVEGGWTGAGTGNLNADPLFADAANHDLTLLAGSPAIDSGDSPNASPHVGAFDLAGNPRFYDEPTVPDTGIPVTSLVIDRGAYEFGAHTLLTGACCVNGACVRLSEEDCSAVGGAYGGDGADCGSVSCDLPILGDLDGDGDVDLTDYLLFQISFTGPQ
jgi:hypothetical protein